MRSKRYCCNQLDSVTAIEHECISTYHCPTPQQGVPALRSAHLPQEMPTQNVASQQSAMTGCSREVIRARETRMESLLNIAILSEDFCGSVSSRGLSAVLQLNIVDWFYIVLQIILAQRHHVTRTCISDTLIGFDVTITLNEYFPVELPQRSRLTNKKNPSYIRQQCSKAFFWLKSDSFPQNLKRIPHSCVKRDSVPHEGPCASKSCIEVM
jgi:hypothetical protein